MRYNSILVLWLFGCLACTMFGQSDKHLTDIFLHSLQSASFPGCRSECNERVPLSDLTSVRLRVWNAWVKANQLFEEPKLPQLAPLSTGTTGQLVLPPTLEPSAVMNYYWGYKGSPVYNSKYPVFIYLHGSGPRDAEWSTGLKLAKLFKDAPSIYFIPRIPNEGAYYRWWQRSKQWAWEWLLRQMFLSPAVNVNRIYVFGISEGGYGSQRLASFYADYWAAAGPMAGGEPMRNAPAENCLNIGFSLLTGAEDKGFYRNELSQTVAATFDSLQAVYPQAFKHRIELIPGRGHSIDYTPTTPWLSTYTRKSKPKMFLWEDFEMDGRHRSGFYNLYVNRRPCDTLRTFYKMEIIGNEVNLYVNNVFYETAKRDSIWGIELQSSKKFVPAKGGVLTLFLDEELVNLSKKVTVRVNGKRVYRGRVACNVNNMMQSLATFYDPQRIFPAAIEIQY